jgi:GNAT superfamily N-acetyltransferase
MDSSGSPEDSPHQPLHRLTVDEVPEAVDVLARTFVDDPFVNWVVRQDARHDEAMHRFFRVCLLLLTMPHGEVWTTHDLSGTAMWTPPGAFKVGPGEQVRFLWQAVQAWGVARIPTRLSAFNEIERHHPKEPHFYLFFVGVDPDRQGEGIGSQLIVPILDRCDAEGLPAYLEATRQDLVPYYARFGYREPHRPSNCRTGVPRLTRCGVSPTAVRHVRARPSVRLIGYE